MELSKFEKVPDLRPAFLWAIELPSFARSEYFIKLQKESGWSKGVFLATLFGAWEHFDMKWQIHAGKERSTLGKEGKKLPEDFGLDLVKETNGLQKGTLTKKLLEEIRFAIEKAYKIDAAQPVFDSYEVIAICQRMLQFIKGEYNQQIKKDSSASYIARRLREKGHTVDGNPEYVVYNYNIISDAPVCDFYRFRNEVRKLMLNSPNPSELKVMLKPMKELCVEIVKIWNTELYKLEAPREEKDMHLAVREQRLIVFDPYEMKVWNRNTQSDDEFYREPSFHFFNHDFAVFARDVANFISYEVLKETAAKSKVKISFDDYKDFDQLFNDPGKAKQCHELLIGEELIAPHYNYTGNLKSAFCVWVNEIERAGLIIHASNETYTRLLNSKFHGLDITESVFRSALTKASRKYQSIFRKAAMKLKQP